MKLIGTLFSLIFCITINAQPSVKVEVSADTIALGEVVEVTYTIENGDGQFEAPDFSRLPLITGPNTSSSFVYQNGKMSSSQSYAYLFRPTEEGKMKIPEAIYRGKSQNMKIESVEVVVNRFGQKSTGKKPAIEAEPAKPAREKKKF
ncbi:MAG TPA: BatD family protein [Saprospiraceae bacterium]|nr:BatD family protein [Saprospiraceae bacterium]